MGICKWYIGTDTGQKLISLDVRGADVLPAENVPLAYRCRVNGQATFTHYKVRKDDQRLYCCLLSPGSPHFEQMTDFVQLVVVGMYLFRELSFTRSDKRFKSSRAEFQLFQLCFFVRGWSIKLDWVCFIVFLPGTSSCKRRHVSGSMAY